MVATAAIVVMVIRPAIMIASPPKLARERVAGR
jgi:hypothetical protein